MQLHEQHSWEVDDSEESASTAILTEKIKNELASNRWSIEALARAPLLSKQVDTSRIALRKGRRGGSTPPAERLRHHCWHVESGYCGKAEASISSQHKVTSRESIDPVFCKKSWTDFM